MSSDYPDDLRYTKEHEWARLNDAGNVVTIGVTKFAVESLGDITQVDLPKEGEELKKDAVFGNVESVKGEPSVDSLFAHIPARLRAQRPLDIEPLDENALLKHLGEIGARSKPAVGATFRDGAALSFLGAGVTPHTIPSAVDMLLQRS